MLALTHRVPKVGFIKFHLTEPEILTNVVQNYRVSLVNHKLGATGFCVERERPVTFGKSYKSLQKAAIIFFNLRGHAATNFIKIKGASRNSL